MDAQFKSLLERMRNGNLKTLDRLVRSVEQGVRMGNDAGDTIDDFIKRDARRGGDPAI
jgi:hypothetical protein